MSLLLLGLVLFIGIHSISIVALPLRNHLAAKKLLVWKLFYSLISLVGIVLIAKGYGDIRQSATVMYAAPLWMHYVTAVILLPSFILFLAPYLPGRISRAIHHPQLISVILWALAHLLVVGTLASILLFGSFLIWAIADRVSMMNRDTRPVPSVPQSNLNDMILILVGLGVYDATVFWLHEALLGITLYF